MSDVVSCLVHVGVFTFGWFDYEIRTLMSNGAAILRRIFKRLERAERLLAEDRASDLGNYIMNTCPDCGQTLLEVKGDLICPRFSCGYFDSSRE